MSPFLSLAFHRPKLALVIAAGVAALLGTGLMKLRTEPALESLMSADLPEVRFYREVKANFGDIASVVVVARSQNLFEVETIASLRNFDNRLSMISGIEDVKSVFSVPVLVKERRGNVVEPLFARPSVDEEFLELAKVKALNSPILSENFVNQAGDAFCFVITLSNQDLFPEKTDSAIAELVALVEESNASHGPEIEFYELGLPTGNAELIRFFHQDHRVVVPLVLLVVGCTVFLFFRSGLAVLLPLLTGALSIVATLGVMGHAGISLNVLLSTIVLLILVLGSTEDFHLLSEFAEGVEDGKSDETIFRTIGSSTGRALFLTSLTTVLGFVSIAFTPLESLREFALTVAVAMALNFFFTVLVVPAVFRLTRRPAAFRDGSWKKTTSWLRSALGNSLLKWDKRILLLCSVGLIAFSIGAHHLVVATDLLKFLPEHSRTATGQRNFLPDFGGATRLMAVVETGESDGVFRKEFEEALFEFHTALEERFAGVVSYVDALDEFDLARERDENGNLPNGGLAELVSSRNFVDHDGSRAVFYVRTANRSSDDIMKDESEVLELSEHILPTNFSVGITGEQVLLAKLSDSVCRQLLVNLCILTVVVAILISLSLRSALLGILSIIPNIFPVVATFGLMGWLGVPFGIGTFPVAIIAFAVAIDDTIHILTRFSTLSESGLRGPQLTLRGVREEIHPVFATSVALCLGYLVLTLSAIPVNQKIGLLFSFAVTVALLADLFLTPVLLFRLQHAKWAKVL